MNWDLYRDERTIPNPQINEIYHIKKLKNKSYMIISIYQEKLWIKFIIHL